MSFKYPCLGIDSFNGRLVWVLKPLQHNKGYDVRSTDATRGDYTLPLDGVYMIEEKVIHSPLFKLIFR